MGLYWIILRVPFSFLQFTATFSFGQLLTNVLEVEHTEDIHLRILTLSLEMNIFLAIIFTVLFYPH